MKFALKSEARVKKMKRKKGQAGRKDCPCKGPVVGSMKDSKVVLVAEIEKHQRECQIETL